ncbi:MAG TPA: FAD/NAD(P)-binding oxidoreductase [Actinomycetales bacterium]|nr:FAD/NAD(P)-binding oxidoreductase [Actinomycetales bacterium]
MNSADQNAAAKGAPASAKDAPAPAKDVPAPAKDAPAAARPTAKDKKLVIVGGGHAGGRAAIALREAGYSGEITMLGNEECPPYERPGLSKGFLQGDESEDDLYLQSATWYDKNQITRRTGVTITDIDPQARSITFHIGTSDATQLGHNTGQLGHTTGSGDVQSEQIEYETLILATGSDPRPLELAGAASHNVCYLRSVEDSKRLKSELAAAKRVTIIGAGWIGLEVAAAARKANCDVAIINRDREPLLGPLGETLAKMFAELHREHGVILRNDTEVTRLIGTDERIAAIETDAGDQIATDLIVAGIGALPRLDLAKSAGLEIKDGGVLVDAQLRTSQPDIYAVGDIAAVYYEKYDRHIRLDHWASAMRQPDTLAAILCGHNTKYDALPYFFTDQFDLGCEYVGYVPPELRDEVEVVVRGDMRSRELIAFYVADHKIWAGMNVNIWDVSAEIEKLITDETRITRDELEDPSVSLSELAAK